MPQYSPPDPATLWVLLAGAPQGSAPRLVEAQPDFEPGRQQLESTRARLSGRPLCIDSELLERVGMLSQFLGSLELREDAFTLLVSLIEISPSEVTAHASVANSLEGLRAAAAHALAAGNAGVPLDDYLRFLCRHFSSVSGPFATGGADARLYSELARAFIMNPSDARFQELHSTLRARLGQVSA